jgi:hypothetical protein
VSFSEFRVERAREGVVDEGSKDRGIRRLRSRSGEGLMKSPKGLWLWIRHDLIRSES